MEIVPWDTEYRLVLQKNTMDNIKIQAAKTIEAAGVAGGLDEVRRLAELGWPESRPLDGDSLELREAIKAEAARVLAGSEPLTIEVREAEMKNYGGYWLPDRYVPGYVNVSTHRTESGARRRASNYHGSVVILRWHSELGNSVFGLYTAEKVSST